MTDSARAAGGGRVAHGRVPMTGRDPGERGRAVTPLELLFDLTFVAAVGTSAHFLAELAAGGLAGRAVTAFTLAMFAISIAWINFSWFSSAFGTDDWLYRSLTMLQMIGVVVFALGLPAMFHSVEEGGHLEIRAIVIGYVVMRIAMVAQWWRAARESPQYRDVGTASIRWTTIAQAGWLVVGFTGLTFTQVFVPYAVLTMLELLIPVLTQGSAGGTPWHPHHVAERYGLFAIITLGEVVVGTVASSRGLLGGPDGTEWSANAVAVVVAGIGLTFGMWWVYFLTPFGDILAYRRTTGYLFGYGHIPVFAGIAGAGAGLHVAGLYLEHDAAISELAVVLSLALPTGLYVIVVKALHLLLLSARGFFHLMLVSLTLVVLGAAVLMAVLGAPVAACLLVVMLAPYVNVVAYETVGHRHQHRLLADLKARRSPS